VQAEITALETEIAALEREQSANTRTLQMEKQQLQLVNARRAQLASKLEEDRKELDKKTQKLAELLTAIDRIMASN
jgi:chromosome segregation ATPase